MDEEIKNQFEETIGKIEDKIEYIKEDIEEKIDEFSSGEETEEFAEDDIKNNKVMAVIAYLGIIVLIPIFCAKESRFARFHSNQGLILLISEVLCAILSNIPVIRWFVWIFELAIAVFIVIGILNAAKGKARRLPIIGSFDLLS